MLTFIVIAVVFALVVWPPPVARHRLRAVLDRPAFRGAPSAARTGWRHVIVPVAVAAGCGVVVTAGVVAASGAALLVVAVVVHRRSRVRARATVEAGQELSGALRGVVTDLRAGADPASALGTAADQSSPELGRRLRALAGAARWGGNAPSFQDGGGGSGYTDRALTRLAAAWVLAGRHGIPLAALLDVVQRDVETTARAAQRLDARLAGARAGTGVLAVLPVVGLALGEAMGAAPVRVLATTPFGSVLLLLGALFLLAGVAWSTAITGRVIT